MGEADFRQYLRLRNQLVNAAESFAREENLTQVLILTISKVTDQQFKLAQKVVDVVERTNKKNCATLLQYNVDKPESSYAQVQFFARTKEDKNFSKLSM